LAIAAREDMLMLLSSGRSADVIRQGGRARVRARRADAGL